MTISVFGCPDPEIAQNAWYKREGNSATIGCEGHDKAWKLKCDGVNWIGVFGNCTSGGMLNKL